MVCKFQFWAPFNLNSWGLRPEAKWQMVCGRDDGFLQSTVRVRGARLILYVWPFLRSKLLNSRFILNLFSILILNVDGWCVSVLLAKKSSKTKPAGGERDAAAVQLWWLWWGRCHIPAACGYSAPRHNDARLRPIKLTQNYIDDIFWARKFHGVRANGLDKISVALNNIWCGVVGDDDSC